MRVFLVMAALLASLATFLAALPVTQAPVEASLCTVVLRPSAFSGKVIRFRAGVLTDWRHATVLIHTGCQQGIELSSTDRVPSHQSKAFDEAVRTPLNGGMDRTAMATFTGHFSFQPGGPKGPFDNPLKFNAERIEDIQVHSKKRPR